MWQATRVGPLLSGVIEKLNTLGYRDKSFSYSAFMIECHFGDGGGSPRKLHTLLCNIMAHMLISSLIACAHGGKVTIRAG